jgi:Zn-dependent protease
MRALRSIIRWFFGLQAVILILSPLAGILIRLFWHPRAGTVHIAQTHAHHAASGYGPFSGAIAGYGFLAGMILAGVIFAMGWWSTRKPSSTPNLWALGASLLYTVEGVTYFVYIHRLGHTSSSGLDLVAIGLAGLFVFFRGESVPAIAAPKRVPVPGDRTSPLTRHAVTVFSTVAQIAAIVFWSRWAYTHVLHGSRGLTWLVLITVASVLTTFIHEFGHAIIAWCFEMGLLSFKAGPFQWVRRQGKWKFKFHPAGLLTPGGAVGAVPTHPEQPRWEETLVILAGPAANLILGLAGIYAVLHDRWDSYQQSWEFVAFTGSFCLVAAVLNLFPFMSEDGAYSDGARILQILTHSPLDDYHRTMAAVASTVITPRRYRDLDVAQIERAAILFPYELRGLHLLLCACHCYEDRGQLAEASGSLASAEAIYNANSIDLPASLHTIFIIGHAWLDRDAAAARLWWNRMEAKTQAEKGTKKDSSKVDFWLAKTALLWIEGNLEESETAWHEAHAEAQRLPAFGAYDFDRDRCAILRQALDNPAQATVQAAAAAQVTGGEDSTVVRPASVAAAPPQVVSQDLTLGVPVAEASAPVTEMTPALPPISAVAPRPVAPTQAGSPAAASLSSQQIDQATDRALNFLSRSGPPVPAARPVTASIPAAIPAPPPPPRPAAAAPTQGASSVATSLSSDQIDQATDRALNFLSRSVPPAPAARSVAASIPTAIPVRPAGSEAAAPTKVESPSVDSVSSVQDDEATARVLKFLARSAPAAPAVAPVGGSIAATVPVPPPPDPVAAATATGALPAAASLSDQMDEAAARALSLFARNAPPSRAPIAAAATTSATIPATPAPPLAAILLPADASQAAASILSAVEVPAVALSASLGEPTSASAPAPSTAFAQPASPVQPPSVTRANDAALSSDPIDQAAARALNFLARIAPAAASPARAASLVQEEPAGAGAVSAIASVPPPLLANAVVPTVDTRSAGSMTRIPSSSYKVAARASASFPDAPAPVAPTPASHVPEIPATPAVASFTRIPAAANSGPAASSSAWSPLPGSARTQLPASSFTPTPAPTAAKSKAVPAAFARRPVRPVPAPPVNPYAELGITAAQESSAIDAQVGQDLISSAPLDDISDTSAPQATAVVASSASSNQVGSTFVVPAFTASPSPPAAKSRVDALDFLRSPAELEKILT